MCDPVTATLVLTGVTTAMTLDAQSEQRKYARGKERYNTRVAENEAQRSRTVATEKENIQRQKTAQLLSKQRAQLGAAGVELGSGSAEQLQEDTMTLGEADALRIRDFGDQQFDAGMRRSDLISAETDMQIAQSRADSTATVLGAAGDVVQTGIDEKWFDSDSAAADGGVE